MRPWNLQHAWAAVVKVIIPDPAPRELVIDPVDQLVISVMRIIVVILNIVMVADPEHQCHRLYCTPLVSDLDRRARAGRNIAVACAVDYNLRKIRASTALVFHNDALNCIPGKNRRNDLRMKQDRDLFLFDHFVQQQLHFLNVKHPHPWAVLHGLFPRVDCADDLAADAALVFLIKKRRNHPHCPHPAKKAVGLHDQDALVPTRGGNCRRDAGRSSAADNDVERTLYRRLVLFPDVCSRFFIFCFHVNLASPVLSLLPNLP